MSWCDPTSGDPVAVREAGLEYQRVAAQIEAAAQDLRGIASGFSERSVAIDEVEAKAGRLAGQIERAQGRYATTGAALVGYADGLALAQVVSLKALTAARTAAQAQSTAQDDVYLWSRRADQAADPFLVAQHTGRADAARRVLVGTDQHLEDARAQMREAMNIRDTAAEAARAAIRAVVDGDDLHDTIWQNLGGGTQEVGLWVWDHVDEAATLIGVLALVLCWVPGLNVALAGLATIAAALVFVRDGVNLATGNGSWGEFGLSALGVVTFGIGRVATKGLQMATRSTRLAQGLRGAVAAEESVEAATTTARATASAANGARRVITENAGSDRTGSILRSGELWSVLKPSAVWADTMGDLRGGVQMFRAPGLYSAQLPGLHVSQPLTSVSNAFVEGSTTLSSTWQANRGAFAFQLVGKEDAARGTIFLAEHGGPGEGWLWSTGATQAVETGLVAHGAATFGAE